MSSDVALPAPPAPPAPAGVQLVVSDRWRLLLASFLSLYLELLLIRWIPSTVHIVAFFNNLVLIACFLGLGIGMARGAAAGDVGWRAFFRLAVTAGLLACLTGTTAITLPESGDYGINELSYDLFLKIPLPLILLAVFALAVWTMVPFGQFVAQSFDRLERLQAYSINIAGSLLGVLAFSGIAWLELPPLVWFAVGVLPMCLLNFQRRHLLCCLVLAVVAIAQHLHNTRLPPVNVVHWSPYYKVVASSMLHDHADLEEYGFRIQVNEQFLLTGLDLRPGGSALEAADPAMADFVAGLRSYYDFPFYLHAPRRVLVLGAGAGNDVAASLRYGAEHVTAVEIDPAVIRLGRRYHPEKPYDSPKVEIVCDDARAYLNRATEKFDLILFGTLDAHGLLSSVGNVRLDSFVYTQESLAAARSHLTDDGLMLLCFGPFREETQFRQYTTMRGVFGTEPLYLRHSNRHCAIVAGAIDPAKLATLPRDWRLLSQQEIAAKLEAYPQAAIPATDDWPHLYVRERRIPREYLGVLAGIILLAVVLVAVNLRGNYSLDGHFFFLGAGFLLLETKSVTEFALLVGATWQVNAAVFTVILLMILVANLLLLTVLKRISVPICYALIAVTLLAGYLWPAGQWATAAGPLTLVVAGAYLGVPMFLAALIFASTFRQARFGSAALASNLLGAVLGGTAEYLSLAYGIRALSLLALAMYVASDAFWLWQGRRRLPGGFS